MEDPDQTCSWSIVCRIVGRGATVYHPINSREGNTCLSWKTNLVFSIYYKNRDRHLHWSRRETRNSWNLGSFASLSFSTTISSNVLTISTSRPFCVPNRAPRTVKRAKCETMDDFYKSKLIEQDRKDLESFFAALTSSNAPICSRWAMGGWSLKLFSN